MFADKKHSKKKGRESDQREKERKIQATMESPKFKSYIDNLKNFFGVDFLFISLHREGQISRIKDLPRRVAKSLGRYLSIPLCPLGERGISVIHHVIVVGKGEVQVPRIIV